MNLGGMGALAGGLAGGYFEGENAKDRRAYADVAKQRAGYEGQRLDLDKQAVDRRTKSNQDMAHLIHDEGHPELAQVFSPGFKPGKANTWQSQAAQYGDYEPGGTNQTPSGPAGGMGASQRSASAAPAMKSTDVAGSLRDLGFHDLATVVETNPDYAPGDNNFSPMASGLAMPNGSSSAQ